MMRLGACLGLLCVSLGALPLPAAADGSRSGKIDEARERMSERSDSDDSDDDDDDDDGSSLLDDDDDDDGEDSEPGVASRIAGRMLYYAIGLPFWAPQLIVGDRRPMRHYVFHPYPYAGGSEGPFRILKLNEQGEPAEASPLAASLRVMASYERLEENLDGRRLRLTLRTNMRVGLDAGITRYDEVLGPGDQDSLWHYQGLITGAFAISPRTQFTFGFGLRGIRFSGDDHHAHIATHYAVELFPVRPLHVWLQGEASVGQNSWATEVEAGLGVILHRFEVFGGYRRFNLVGVAFAGPEVGVMAWF